MMAPAATQLADDLDEILARTPDVWAELKGQRLFITGGTSFVGCWLLESLLWANDRLNLGVSAVLLTRNAAGFRRNAPALANQPVFEIIEGDVRSFALPKGGFSHVLHLATEAPAKDLDDKPLVKFQTMVTGTERVLELARQCGASKVLLTSSGAVYAPQPPEMTHMPESYAGACDPTSAKWVNGEAKRASEMLCALYASQYGLDSKIARLFSFVGPYLQLDFHYAAGSFVRSALRGEGIRLEGDGTPIRSYLYASDLTVWLWTILARGETCRAYNVGSDQSVTIKELADVVAASVTPAVSVDVARQAVAGAPRHRYVPSVDRAKAELGLEERTGLADGIGRTVSWYRALHQSGRAFY